MFERVGFLFPGQGSQSVGMGRDLAAHFSSAREIFDKVDEICDKPISRLCFEGPLEELTLTVNLQPAITAVNLACLAALNESGIHASVSAGHSLGEYAALVSAGVVNTQDALQLVQKRGELMHREAVANPGGMIALVGLEIDAVQELIENARDTGVLSVANHNTAEQIVATGQKECLSRLTGLAKEKKARAIPLKVSGAWHSALMEGAVDDFREFLEGIRFSAPTSNILFNATALSETEPARIRELMAVQLINPVKWHDIILNMLEDGVGAFVEVGPGKVLSGLVKKIVPADGSVKIHNVEGVESLEKLLDLFS